MLCTRALLALPAAEQILVGTQVVAKRLSVRDTEKLVSSKLATKDEKTVKRAAASQDLLRLESDLSDKLGATVKIKTNKKGAGSMTIDFGSLDQLDGLLERFK